MLILSAVPIVSLLLNKLVTVMLVALDGYIQHIDALPLSVYRLSYFSFGTAY